MKLIREKMKDLRALYTNQARLMLSAEQQIVRALPRTIEKANDEELREAFRTHLRETEGHVARIQGIVNHLTAETAEEKCGVVAALITEAEEMIEDSADIKVRDAALIAAAQRVEHYEIASYGALRHFAQVMGLDGDAEILNQTIHEEGHADHLLSEIAERINPGAQKAA
jgi:ferritin-like metal-binding protein YciE